MQQCVSCKGRLRDGPLGPPRLQRRLSPASGLVVPSPPPVSTPARLLPTHLLPPTLWADNMLVPPTSSRSVYRAALKALGLVERALASAPAGAVGGDTAELTHQHFCENFSGSCGRFQLACLDPRGELGGTSDVLVQAAAGGRLAVLDLLSGAGAATLTLLGVIVELRRAGVVPRQPLDVTIVGADHSLHAAALSARVHEQLPGLEEQAITCTAVQVEWDMRSADSTTALLHRWTSVTHGCDRHLMVLANGSGALTNESNMKKAHGPLEEVFRWSKPTRSAVVWIEHRLSDRPGRGFFHTLYKKFAAELVRAIGLPASEPAAHLKSDARCHSLLEELPPHPVGLSIVVPWDSDP